MAKYYRNLFEKIAKWIREHTLFVCPRCGSIKFSKDKRREWLTTGKPIILCSRCWRELYTPWTQDE